MQTQIRILGGLRKAGSGYSKSKNRDLQNQKKKPVHFFSHMLQVSTEQVVISLPSSISSPAEPQNLHVQFGQCQSPAGSICNVMKDLNTLKYLKD